MKFPKLAFPRKPLARLALGFAVFGVLALGIGLVTIYFLQPQENLYLAIGGDVDSPFGVGMIKGAELYANKVNAAGGINGRRVVIDVSEQYRDSTTDAQRATEIVAQNRALGVVGHTFSGGSLAAGPIYAQNGIVAISPSATNVNVTRENPWYFRTIFNDQVQGNLLGAYTAEVLNARRVAIIAHDQPYGDYLARIFRLSAWSLGTTIAYDYRVTTDGSVDLEQEIEKIVRNLDDDNYRDFIFLAADLEESLLLIQKLRDRGMKNPIVGTDQIASNEFLHGFDHLPKERTRPGYYTNGIYVTTPVLFRTGDDTLQQFLADYRAAYGEDPNWEAAFAYDAALMLGEAARATGATGQTARLPQERQEVRDYLASLQLADQGIVGVTGLNYFDEHGDMLKPPGIGIVQDRQIIPALNQVRQVATAEEAAELQAATGAEFVVRVAEQFVYKTSVAYVGVELSQVEELDIENQAAMLNFILWFRFAGDFDPEDIVFTNAIEPIQLGDPIVNRNNGLVSYQSYRVRGRFKLDFLPDQHTYKQHIVGIQFRHRSLSEEVLIYVPDTLGMQITPETPLGDQIVASQAFSPTLDWRLERAWLFRDTEEESARGQPNYLQQSRKFIDFSRINLAILLIQDDLSLTSLLAGIAANALPLVLIPLVVGLGLVFAADALPGVRRFAILSWMARVILALLTLATAQVLIIQNVAFYLRQADGGTALLDLVVAIFDVLWWVLPTVIIYSTLDRFIWKPLEQQTGRAVPRILVRLVEFMLFGGMVLGILAFVFDQSIGHLLAASGVITLVIGLALQVNISNFFSGIALNLERPLRVGDWVQVGDHEEGQVIDMNWRSTRILTRSNTVVSLPNGLVAEADVQNFNLDKHVWLGASLYVFPTYDPGLVLTTLHQSVSEIEGVLDCPAPQVYLASLDDVGALYNIRYAIDDYGDRDKISNAVWQNIWYGLREAGINMVADSIGLPEPVEGDAAVVTVDAQSPLAPKLLAAANAGQDAPPQLASPPAVDTPTVVPVANGGQEAATQPASHPAVDTPTAAPVANGGQEAATQPASHPVDTITTTELASEKELTHTNGNAETGQAQPGTPQTGRLQPGTPQTGRLQPGKPQTGRLQTNRLIERRQIERRLLERQPIGNDTANNAFVLRRSKKRKRLLGIF